MTTISIVAGQGVATARLVERLARQGSRVKVAADATTAADLIVQPADVLILTGATAGAVGDDWRLGLKSEPVLMASDLPAKIAAKLVILDVPDGGALAQVVAARLAPGSIVLHSPHTKGGKDFLEDSTHVLPEFITTVYDRFGRDAEELLGSWLEVEAALRKAASGVLQRRREPAPYRVVRFV